MNKLKIYGLEIILLLVLSCALAFNLSNSRIVISLFLLFYAIITAILIRKNRTLSVNSKKVFKLLLLLGIIYIGLLYTLGIYTGFYKATVKFSLASLFKYIIPITVIIISSEFIRNKLLNYDNKLVIALNFIIQIIIDLLIYTSVYKFDSLENIMTLIGYALFASIACNLLYNYIGKRYGVKPNIVYRLITVLYIYIIPIIPDIYMFFLSFYRMVYPFIIYYILDSFYGETEDATGDKNNKIINFITLIASIILILYIALISCAFRFGALVIGSGSMTGTINKGDVIIFDKNIQKENVEKGDIIVFTKDKIKIVHRVIDKKKTNGEYRFYTKGDNNKKEDKGYITEDDIYGSVSLKIKHIGKPTIWLHDMFDK